MLTTLLIQHQGICLRFCESIEYYKYSIDRADSQCIDKIIFCDRVQFDTNLIIRIKHLSK
jgi:hypothetical protein